MPAPIGHAICAFNLDLPRFCAAPFDPLLCSREDDLGVGFSILHEWMSAHRGTDVVSAEDRDLARGNERPRREGATSPIIH